MYREPDRQLSTTAQTAIVDRLLAELPHASAHQQANPHHHSEPAPRQARQHSPPTAIPHRAAPRVPRSAPRWRPLTQVGRARSSYEHVTSGSWARVTLAMFLGVAMVFWPYPMCGAGLLGYFGGTAAVISAAVWSAAVSWDRRAGTAHVFSIGLLLWGLALAGDQLLQRTGYAYAQLAWGCG